MVSAAAIFASSFGLLLRRLRVDNETSIYALLFICALVWFVPPLREHIISRIELFGFTDDFGRLISIALLCLCIGLAAVATTDAAVTFVIVPGLSAFGTSGDAFISPPFLGAFLLFIFASIFVLAYGHILAKTTHLVTQVKISQSARRALLFASLCSLLLFLAAHLGTLLASRVEPQLNNVARSVPAESFLPRLPFSLPERHDQPLKLGSRPPIKDERIAFFVNSEAPVLRRVSVYNEYTGKSWELLPPQAPQRIPFPSDFANLAPDVPSNGKQLLETYTIYSLLSENVVAAATPVAIEGVSSPLFVDAFGNVRGERPTHPNAVYSVTSLVVSPTADQLRQVRLQFPQYFADYYLRIPQLAYKVSSIAQEVAGNQPTVFDKVLTLQRYLEDNFTYTLRPPPFPTDQDFVTWFLTDAKAGYCEAFASALVVMARSLGIPARLATGFAPGEYNSSTRGYVVKGKDAHAWAEIYFGKEFGWLSFDPQAVRQDMSSSKRPSDIPRNLNLLIFRLFHASPHRLVVVLILLCAVVLLVGPIAVKAFNYPRPRRLPPQDDRDRICRIYSSMCSTLGKMGLSRQPSQTPLEYLAHLSLRLRFTSLDILTHINRLTELHLQACYSPDIVVSSHLESAFSALESVRRSTRLLRSRR
jgi:hypothetical protein